MNRYVVLAMVVLAFAIAGCNGSGPAQQPAAGGPPILNGISAVEVVDAMGAAKLPVAHVEDVTKADCADTGCVAKIDTDAVSVMQFPTTGSAQRFAGETRDSYVVENLALVFSSGVPKDLRHRYERVVAGLI